MKQQQFTCCEYQKESIHWVDVLGSKKNSQRKFGCKSVFTQLHPLKHGHNNKWILTRLEIILSAFHCHLMINYAVPGWLEIDKEPITMYPWIQPELGVLMTDFSSFKWKSGLLHSCSFDSLIHPL